MYRMSAEYDVIALGPMYRAGRTPCLIRRRMVYSEIGNPSAFARLAIWGMVLISGSAIYRTSLVISVTDTPNPVANLPAVIGLQRPFLRIALRFGGEIPQFLERATTVRPFSAIRIAIFSVYKTTIITSMNYELFIVY
jgi:hypothetical protein